jgi:hypothetical protein
LSYSKEHYHCAGDGQPEKSSHSFRAAGACPTSHIAKDQGDGWRTYLFFQRDAPAPAKPKAAASIAVIDSFFIVCLHPAFGGPRVSRAALLTSKRVPYASKTQPRISLDGGSLVFMSLHALQLNSFRRAFINSDLEKKEIDRARYFYICRNTDE